VSDLDWAADLFEGEGSVYLNKGKYPYLCVRSTDEDVVRRFATITDGNVSGPYGPHGISKKPIWACVVYGRKAVKLMKNKKFNRNLGARRQGQVAEVLRGLE
jgi:hypothetical protein